MVVESPLPKRKVYKFLKKLLSQYWIQFENYLLCITFTSMTTLDTCGLAVRFRAFFLYFTVFIYQTLIIGSDTITRVISRVVIDVINIDTS